MRRCRINLPNRCYHLVSRVAHRAFEFEGLQAANRKGRYDKEKLLWQFTVAIKSEPVGSAAVLSRKVQRLEGIPDICLVKSKDMAFRRRRDGCTVAVLIRANAVLVCEVRGEAGDIGAGISTLFSFYGDSKNYKLPINGGTEQ